MLVTKDIMELYKSACVVFYHNISGIKRGGKVKEFRFKCESKEKMDTLNVKREIEALEANLMKLPDHERLVVIIKDMGEGYHRKEIVTINTTAFPKPSSVGKNYPLPTQRKLAKSFIKSLCLPENYFVAVFFANSGKEEAFISV